MSEIVGILIMLAIVVGLGVLFFLFATGGMNGLSENYATGMSGRANAAKEKFAVEQVAFASSGAMAIDGTGTNQVSGGSSSIAATLTTASAMDVIIAYVSAGDAGSASPPSVSGISGGGLTWTHRATTLTQTFTGNHYVPLTLSNGQTSATPNPFQQQVIWNPSTYATYELSDLGNIRFCGDSACATILNAWLESCTPSCSTSATSATAWVKLTSAIPANGGALTIYLVFEATSVDFDGNHWGEAPTLSGTYGQFDNGANVFTFYDDFKSNCNAWTTVASGGGSVTCSNGATFTTSTNGDYVFLADSSTLTQPSIAEAYMVSESTTVDPMMGVSTSTSANNWVALYNGYSVDDCPGGCGGPGLSLDWQISSGGGNVATQAENFNAGIWQLIWSAVGTESASDGAITLTGADGTVTPIANYGIFVGQSNSVAGSNVADWGRMRAYPPSNVMPSVSFGSTGSTTSTFDLEEWYATTSSALSAATITATLSISDSAGTWIAVFGISGASTANPFDSNPAVPATAAAVSNVQTAISTSNPDDTLLFACAAGGGGIAAGFSSIYANTYSPYQNEYVAYEPVSTTQTSLAVSCGGANTYGAEITDAVAATYGGADVYVRNLGNIATTLVSVYVTDMTTGQSVSQASISTTVNVGSFAQISHSTLFFTPSHGHAYLFTVTSSLGNSVEYRKGAT